MTPILDLIDALARQRLTLFIGADLPSDVTGLPSRADLAQGLAQRNRLDETLSLAAVAQRVARGGQRWEFTDYLGRALDTTGKQPQHFHELVVRLGAPMIITTAYDTLLERAFEQANQPINRFVRSSDVAFADPRRSTLIKLYGDVLQRDMLVVTEDDQYALWRNRDKEDLLNEVRSALSKTVVLFLGYSLADPDFNVLWRETLDRMGRFAAGAYVISADAPADVRAVWEGRQVRSIVGDTLTLLGQLSGAHTPLSATYFSNTGSIFRADTAKERTQLETLRNQYKSNLYTLQLKAAKYGSLETPLSVLNEIEETKQKIEEIDTRLAVLQKDEK